jgi:hypothetical protein
MARDDRDWWRAGHPDDHLRRLARGRSSPISVPVYRGYRRGPDPVRRARVALAVLAALIAGVVAAPLLWTRHTIVLEGEVLRGAIRADEVRGSTVTVRISPASQASKATVVLDGAVVALRTGGQLAAGLGEIVLPSLVPGRHRLEVSSGQRVLWRGPGRTVVSFDVDATAPTLSLTPVAAATRLDAPVMVAGKVADAEDVAAGRSVTVTVNDVAVPVAAPDGGFRVQLPRAPVGGVRVVASDTAGNRAEAMLDIGVGRLLPRLRMVYVPVASWADQVRREALLGLAASGRITAVLLDIKSPDGQLGYVSSIPLARQVGAVSPRIDLRAAISQMKAAGLVVAGRISVFHDPVLAAAAWRAGNTRQVVLDRRGGPVGGTPVWTNPLDRDVRNYHLALAREAAEAGADVVVFDRVQRPPGAVAEMDLPDPVALDDALVEVLRGAAMVLADTPTRIAVMAEVAEDAPEYTAQPVARFARAADYVLPVLFPARWSKGSFDVVDPIANPYTIVFRALPAVRTTLGPGAARVVAVLQDFSVRLDYGRKQVAAQIQGVADRCLEEFLVWDPKGTYVAKSLPVGAPSPAPAAAC